MGLPGDIVKELDGSGSCFFCTKRPAVLRVQGETDSFGAEYNDICRPCHQSSTQEDRARREQATCDWCKKRNGPTSYCRDIDEGLSGPVYLVCGDCRKKQNDAIEEELEYYRQRGYVDDEDWSPVPVIRVDQPPRGAIGMTRYRNMAIPYEDAVRFWIWDRRQERYVRPIGDPTGEPLVFDTEEAAREHLVSIHQDAADSPTGDSE